MVTDSLKAPGWRPRSWSRIVRGYGLRQTPNAVSTTQNPASLFRERRGAKRTGFLAEPPENRSRAPAQSGYGARTYTLPSQVFYVLELHLVLVGHSGMVMAAGGVYASVVGVAGVRIAAQLLVGKAE